jgi:superfamily II DNA or RNA helicase
LNKKKNNFSISEKNNIFISNMQYLMKNGDQLGYIDMIIQDEVHVISKGAKLSNLIRGVDIDYKFGCTGTLPKNIESRWAISGIFGPVLEEIKIKELQQKNILADVNIVPIEYLHNIKRNFYVRCNDTESIFDISSRSYKNEAMYLGEYLESNIKTLALAKKLIEVHNDWNILILFDYISQGEILYKLLDFDKKHYVDGSIDVDIRAKIIEQMNAKEGGHITIANCKCFGTGLTIKHIQSIFLVQNASSSVKIIQSIGRGLQKNKNTLYLFDIFHNYKYSEKHFYERCNLYKEFYNKSLDKDFKVKQIALKNKEDL